MSAAEVAKNQLYVKVRQVRSGVSFLLSVGQAGRLPNKAWGIESSEVIMDAIYDDIGNNYSVTRCTDPKIAKQLYSELQGANFYGQRMAS